MGTMIGVVALALFASSAVAGAPTHVRDAARDLSGFNHACGVAVDSEGDVYVASAGESKIEVFDAAHVQVASIPDAHEPCALAVDPSGSVYVSEKASGNVVKYVPNAYPFSGSPGYGASIPIDSSTNAKGIAVDPSDGRLYVAEENHVARYKPDGSFEANLVEGEVANATGVAFYTSPSGDRYLYVAEAVSNQIEVFSTAGAGPLKHRETISGPGGSESFAFGAAGAYLAVDPGNVGAEDKCASVKEQACTAGHMLVYDAAHNAVDEFDASGRFLDQFTDGAFADAQPTAMAIDRSGKEGDGTIYASASAGPGAKVLAFGPLSQPSRATLGDGRVPGEPLSHVLAKAQAVGTDSHGNVYVAAASLIHVFGPSGKELKVGALENGKGIGDPEIATDLAIDSTGKVYVLDEGSGFSGRKVTYYTPSVYPPVDGTTYARHEPPVATEAEFPAKNPILRAIAVNPGPSAGKDHLFVTTGELAHEYDSAANGSGLLKGAFAASLAFESMQSIGIDGASGNFYVGSNLPPIHVLTADGTEIISQFDGSGCPQGKLGANPFIAVDQSNGHAIEFQPVDEAGREYDASGACVAEFGKFTNAFRPYRVAVDSACAIHSPPLTESTVPTCHEYDPANGSVYVAYEHTNPNTNPYDLSAFGPLAYGEPPSVVTEPPSGVSGPEATLEGVVNPKGFEVSACTFQYLSEDQYRDNGKGFAGAKEAACVPGPAEIGKGNAPVPVHAVVSDLAPAGNNCYRLLAVNKYGSGKGDALCFGSPEAKAKAALPTLYTETTLRAEIDPAGLATEYHFAYGEVGGPLSHTTAVKVLAATAPPGEVTAALTGLAESTEYRFQIIAESQGGTATDEGAFTTLGRLQSPSCPNAEYRNGLSANLPDCRAYELVTPAETKGLAPSAASPGAPGALFSTWPTSQQGEQSLTYFTEGTLPGFDGNGRQDGYRAQRAEGDHPAAGWASSLFGPTYPESVPSTKKLPQSQGVSPDQLYSFWKIEPEETLPQTLEEGVYLLGPAGSANPACNPQHAQDDFELVGCGALGKDPKAISRYISLGGAHVIFSSKVQLEGAAPSTGTVAIYDRAAGSAAAKVVSLPPESASPGGKAEFRAAEESKEGTIYQGASEDGSTIVFKVGPTLYARAGNAKTEVLTKETAGLGERLSCSEGPLHGVTDGNRNFEWLRNSIPIPGASGSGSTSTAYTTVAADAGTAIQCRVFDLEGGTGSVSVSAPIRVEPVDAGEIPNPPEAIAAPTPANPGAGTVEICDPGIWTGASDPLVYQWYLDGEPVPSATGPTYEVKAGDLPGAIQCQVSGANAAGAVAKSSLITQTNPAPNPPAPVASASADLETSFAGVSRDGGWAFYALGNGTSPASLFSFNLESESGTEIAPSAIFAGVSPNGSRVFFSSEKDLTGIETNEHCEGQPVECEEAEPGAHNLYSFDTETKATHFIAQLDLADFANAGFGGIVGMNFGAWTQAVGPGGSRALVPTRATPDGGTFAFQSHARLTEYDNEGVGEIYRYDPSAVPGERLVCSSCDPSGVSPSADALFEDLHSGSGINSTTQIANLTEDGRGVFFQSPDRLLPEDANAFDDVYEWRESEDEGSCKRRGGCLALISSGQGDNPSTLYGMSADGHDVFFRTLQKLLGADVVGSSSIYDARVGGGIPEVAEGAPCQGDACQPPGSGPPARPAAASTGSTEGNVSGPPARCAKGRHRVKGRCVKAHKKHGKHQRRAHHKRGGSR